MSEVISNSIVGEAIAGFGLTVLTAAAIEVDLLPDTTTTVLAGLATGSVVIGHALWRAANEIRHTSS